MVIARCRQRLVSDASHRREGRAFTLTELILSLAIMSILMTGVASAILIASRALPDDDLTEPVTRTAEIADRLAEELASAIWIRERGQSNVSFTVPDRDGDGLPERVRYDWWSMSDNTLTREYNDTVTDTLRDISDFYLVFRVKTVTEEYPGPLVEGSEILLSNTLGNCTRDYKIDSSHWIGQYLAPLAPSLAPDAVSWRPTRLYVVARYDGPVSSSTLVQFRTPNADNTPTDVVLEEAVLLESSMPGSYSWVQVPFEDARGFSPDQAYCLVLQYGGGDGASGKVIYDQCDVNGLLKTSDAGASWTYYGDICNLVYYLYGKVRTPGPPQEAAHEYVTSVKIDLQSGDDVSKRVVTTAQPLNTPELLIGMWETDFDADPTLDHNGDGTPDWTVDGGGAFNPGSLGGGIWYADTALISNPASLFINLTTLEVRFRSTTCSGDPPSVQINADCSGDSCASLSAYADRQPDGTQILDVFHMKDSTSKELLVSVTGLSGDFITLRFLIDPGLDTVNVRVNGEDQGTYVYNIVTLGGGSAAVTPSPGAGGAEFNVVTPIGALAAAMILPQGGIGLATPTGASGVVTLSPGAGGAEFDYVSVREQMEATSCISPKIFW